MRLKWKLFVFFGSLMALLMLTQWWLVRSISSNTVEEFASTTIDVTRQIVDFFNQQLLEAEPGENVKVIREGDADLIEQFVIREADPADAGQPNPHSVVRNLRLSTAPDTKTKGKTPGAPPESRRLEARLEVRDRLPAPGLEAGSSDTTHLSISLAGGAAEKEISISSDQLQASLKRFQTQLLLGTGFILLLGLAVAGLLADRISQPLQELARASSQIARGNWGLEVSGRGTAEVGTAVAAFNQMSRELEEYARAREAWQQERHVSELGEVARSLAHTIRNPLNALGLCLDELAAHSEPSPESDELLRSGRLQIQRIDHWIRSFLTLASQSGSLVEEVKWSEVAEDLAFELSQTGDHNLIQLDDLPDTLPCVIGVQAEIRGMLQALLSNALEASPRGVPVYLRGHLEGDKIIIEVEDQGSGVAADLRRNLFAPHVTNKVNGSGMGLYLTRQIATTRYQGDLELRNNQPRGTVARLTLGRKRTGA